MNGTAPVLPVSLGGTGSGRVASAMASAPGDGETTATETPCGAPIVGQRAIIAAFELLAVDPGLGGIVLIGGPGWGRRYLAEAFRAWLPAGSPFVRAPVSPTWEALQGGTDWEATLREGRRVYRPGLLAQAAGGALYLPRAETLPAAKAAWLASSLDRKLPHVPGTFDRPVVLAAWERVEGHNETPYPSGLGPLGERLAFALSLDRLASAPERFDLLSAVAVDAMPHTLAPIIAPHIEAARVRLAGVRVDDRFLHTLCSRAIAFGLTNPRLEVLAARAARARAALRGDDRVNGDDVEAAIALVLTPRRRDIGNQEGRNGRVSHQGPAAPPAAFAADGTRPEGRLLTGPSKVGPYELGAPEPWDCPASKKSGDTGTTSSSLAKVHGTDLREETRTGTSPSAPVGGPLSRAQLQVYAAVQETRLRRSAQSLLARRGARPALAVERRRPSSTGRLPTAVKANIVPGPVVSGRRLSLTATLTAALPHQPFRPRHPSLAWNVQPEDLRWHPPKPQRGTLFVLVVDSSGSMGPERSRVAKGLALALLREAYRDRSAVGVIRCSGRHPSVVLAPTRSVTAAAQALRDMPTGGGTPLPGALAAALRLVERARRRDPLQEAVVVILTDGRANVPIRGEATVLNDAGPVPVEQGVREELAALGRALRKERLDVVVVDRDSAACPADDARGLAALLNCPFWPL